MMFLRSRELHTITVLEHVKLTCNIAPTIMDILPATLVLRRPSELPINTARSAPTVAPASSVVNSIGKCLLRDITILTRSQIDVTVPCILADRFPTTAKNSIRLFSLRPPLSENTHVRGAVMIPD
jgi:hypothetical protein